MCIRDRDCIVHNYRELKSRLTPGCRTMAVVKADAYGHGDGYVSRALQQEGADWFAVSNINEAISLRRQEVARPILILGCTPPEMAHTLAELGISQTVYSEAVSYTHLEVYKRQPSASTSRSRLKRP